jgi:hypothetical protein
MTKLEEVISKTDNEITDYLCETSIHDFRRDVEELKKAYVDQNMLSTIIANLQSLQNVHSTQ